MEKNCPQKVWDVLFKRGRKQATLKKSLVQTDKRIRIARQTCSLQAETDRVVTTYHLVKPKAKEAEPNYLQAGEEVAIRVQGTWSAITLAGWPNTNLRTNGDGHPQKDRKRG